MTRLERRGVLCGGIALCIGFVVGAGAGLLWAPRSGTRTRRHLQAWGDDIGQRASAFAEETKQTIHTVL